jgi:hypothetical protein
LENIAKKQHADVQAYPIDEDTIALLNAPNNALIGEFIHQHHMRPIVWEQTWYEQDAYYCENNIITTNIIGGANNSSPITSTTSGEAAEEYLSEYMVKAKTSLKQAVPSLLVTLDQIIAHTSKAEVTGSIIWMGIHLAQCTVNTFSGSHQWFMPLMTSALLGNKSIASSELFCYIFLHANVSYMTLISMIQTCAMMNVQRAHIQWMRTMNMHNPVLMQSWKQFKKMMITMRFVEVQILTQQQMAR